MPPNQGLLGCFFLKLDCFFLKNERQSWCASCNFNALHAMEAAYIKVLGITGKIIPKIGHKRKSENP
jgi:hypothetical protein